MRTFSRRDEGSYDEDVDINAVVRSSVSLVGNLITKRTGNLKLELGNDIPQVKGNFQRLEQVVINLLQNAAQALESPDKAITVVTLHDKCTGTVTLRVKDEGRGISKKDLEHIFDPFFTTKRSCEGTGLGLSICKKIVERHRGNIDISSSANHGTEIRVTIYAMQQGP